jgi:heme exporter protein C
VSDLKTLWHRLGSPRSFYLLSRRLGPWLSGLGVVALAVAFVWGLAIAPPDYQQGNSFRIMYLHVPAAILAQHCYMLMGVAGVVLLVWRMKLADMVIAAAAPFGLLITGLALATGSIWGRPTWGTWWVWDARTTSVLVQFFLYMGVIALRQAIAREETAGRACAVLAIVGTVNIPIIKYSVDWWLTLHQPATFKLTEAPSMPPEMYLPLVASVLGFYLLFGGVLFARTANVVLDREARTQWVRDLVAARAGRDA